jgi:hypothetical protein
MSHTIVDGMDIALRSTNVFPEKLVHGSSPFINGLLYLGYTGVS